MPYKKVIRYPLKAHDDGDGTVTISDGEDYYVLYQNRELQLHQWQFIVNVLNEAAEKGKFIPEAQKPYY